MRSARIMRAPNRWGSAAWMHQAQRAALRRPTLAVEVGAMARRILFEADRAVGIASLHDGELRSVRATREVILSGGTINSPQLLVLSGVGPAEHLRALGIPVRLDAPLVRGKSAGSS